MVGVNANFLLEVLAYFANLSATIYGKKCDLRNN